MNLRRSLAPLLLALLTAASPAQQEASFRSVRGTVLGLDGKPAAGRDVYLAGLSRGSMGPRDEAESKARAWWAFKTDADGRFTARIGDLDAWSDEQQRPGWGEYALVVERSDRDAGAVSPKFVSEKTPPPEGVSATADEWGEPVKLTPEGLDLVLKVQPGITLKGRVVDYSNSERGLAGIRVGACNDLHADTHTGYGGEIFDQFATTDADGRFTLTHIYPSRFDVGLGEPARTPSTEDLTWLKTKLDGRWQDDAVDSLTPAPGQDEMAIVIAATGKSLFRYHGKVTNADGAPVGGAEVWIGVSFHREGGSFQDNHASREAATNADGAYDMRLPTPWVRAIGARKDGFRDAEQWGPNDNPGIPPGEYNFKLTTGKSDGEKVNSPSGPAGGERPGP